MKINEGQAPEQYINVRLLSPFTRRLSCHSISTAPVTSHLETQYIYCKSTCVLCHSLWGLYLAILLHQWPHT